MVCLGPSTGRVFLQRIAPLLRSRIRSYHASATAQAVSTASHSSACKAAGIHGHHSGCPFLDQESDHRSDWVQ
jgi:hypothetical protein